MTGYQVYTRAKHLLTAKHWRGAAIHSPAIFAFVRKYALKNRGHRLIDAIGAPVVEEVEHISKFFCAKTEEVEHISKCFCEKPDDADRLNDSITDQSDPHKGKITDQSDPHKGRITDQSDPHKGKITDQSDPHKGRITDQSDPHKGKITDQSDPHKGKILILREPFKNHAQKVAFDQWYSENHAVTAHFQGLIVIFFDKKLQKQQFVIRN